MIWRMTLSGMVRPLLVAVALVVSLAPLQAQDTAAKALVINGDVSVLRDGNPWALFEGNTVRPKQMVKTGPDGYARFQVSDGSTFEVFPNSQVMFRDNPPSWKDLLDVVIGRVKVYIQHLPGVPNPNNVSSPTAVISVRGTVFVGGGGRRGRHYLRQRGRGFSGSYQQVAGGWWSASATHGIDPRVQEPAAGA
jgi:hypothetical protein